MIGREKRYTPRQIIGVSMPECRKRPGNSLAESPARGQVAIERNLAQRDDDLRLLQLATAEGLSTVSPGL